MIEVRSELTDYGFRFGPALVERLAEINGTVVLRITTGPEETAPGKTLIVYVSPKGRSVRVFQDGKELK